MTRRERKWKCKQTSSAPSQSKLQRMKCLNPKRRKLAASWAQKLNLSIIIAIHLETTFCINWPLQSLTMSMWEGERSRARRFYREYGLNSVMEKRILWNTHKFTEKRDVSSKKLGSRNLERLWRHSSGLNGNDAQSTFRLKSRSQYLRRFDICWGLLVCPDLCTQEHRWCSLDSSHLWCTSF